MPKTPGEKDLNASLPARLWDELDAIKKGFGPFRKKHLVAAAIAAFLRLTLEQQREDILRAEREYYRTVGGREMAAVAADVTDEQSASAGQEAASVVLQAEQLVPAVKARPVASPPQKKGQKRA